MNTVIPYVTHLPQALRRKWKKKTIESLLFSYSTLGTLDIDIPQLRKAKCSFVR